MTKDTQSRKWQITINNPIEKGYTVEKIKDINSNFKSLVYYCLSDETGEQGTFHTHIYIVFASAVRFSTLQKKYEGAHFEMARGTSEENRNYVFKIGKWEKSEKGTTNHKESHFEFGDLPIERQGKRNDLDDLYDMIKSGMTNYDIIEDNPSYMLNVDKIDRCRQILVEREYADKWRDLQVTYVFGHTGTGKTRSVMDGFGYSNVYRVTDYVHPFDSYDGEDVIVFEEFRSSLRIGDMLKYLDGYPLKLPARYCNKVACFTKVFILSNIDLIEQYKDIQRDEYGTWLAFLRRIQNIEVYSEYGIFKSDVSAYIDGFRPCFYVPNEFEETKKEMWYDK